MKIPMHPPPMKELIADISLARVFDSVRGKSGSYYHWDELRHREPPGDLSLEEWWFGLKLARSSTAREMPLRDAGGKPFSYTIPDALMEMTHRVDSDARGQVEFGDQITNPDTRDRYIVSSVIEEAITSSQLEGAATTRLVASRMLRSGRKPQTVDERMIVNNYQAMQFIRENRNSPLTPKMILELHRILTEGTLEDPSSAGRLQHHGETRVRVLDEASHTVLHNPPPAKQLPRRLEQLCDFGNAHNTDQGFIHPVLRAVILHFWLAYDHPFVDGNGRVARSLFYWSLLSQGYWLAEFISISRLLRKAPAQYGRSFLYVETDDNDLTYFLIAQLKVLLKAIDELKRYLRRKVREIREVEKILRYDEILNHRQRALLAHAMRHPSAVYSIASHQRSHNVAYATARSDLLELVDRRELVQSRAGRRYEFQLHPDVAKRGRHPSRQRKGYSE